MEILDSEYKNVSVLLSKRASINLLRIISLSKWGGGVTEIARCLACYCSFCL